MAEKKVVHLDERIPKIKNMRKRKTNRRFIFFIALFFLFILAIIYMESPLSLVKEIKVANNHYLSSEKIINTSGITTDTNIWDIDEGAVRAKLKKLPIIANATIETAFYNKVIIHVEEHQRVGYLRQDGRYIPLLENGEFLTTLESSHLPTNAPVLRGWGDDEALGKIAQELVKVPEAIVRAMSEIHYTPNESFPNGVTVYMNSGIKVLLSVNTFAEKMKLYPKIKANLKPGAEGVMHLRVGGYFQYTSTKESKNED